MMILINWRFGQWNALVFFSWNYNVTKIQYNSIGHCIENKKKGIVLSINKLPASTWSCDSESGIYLLFSSSPQKIETGSLSFSFDEPMY